MLFLNCWLETVQNSTLYNCVNFCMVYQGMVRLTVARKIGEQM